jgi:hypothetical protein
MSTPAPSPTLAGALSGIPADFRTRLLKAYFGLKAAAADRAFDACGLRAGRFAEVLLRWLQHELTSKHTPFGTKIANFTDECAKLERTPAVAGHDSVRILMPRALHFMYTLRNKRGIGHEGGDIDANEIDAVTVVRLADWCISELVRLKHKISIEEAQVLCDQIAERQLPQIWSVFGRRRVLDPTMSYADQTLLLLYASGDGAVATEDLFSWTEYSNGATYRRSVLGSLHSARVVEYDRDTEMVAISPKGIKRVETELLQRVVRDQ